MGVGFGYNTKDRSHISLSLFINDLVFPWISMRFQLDFELRLSLLPIVFGIHLRKTRSTYRFLLSRLPTLHTDYPCELTPYHRENIFRTMRSSNSAELTAEPKVYLR